MNARKTWAEAALIALFTTVGLLTLRDLTNITIFQDRDLLRAAGILDGKFITYGPEASGGGFLPGPFYYFLLALPLAVKPTWLSAYYFMTMLSGAAVGLAWLCARRFFSLPAAMVMVLTVVTMPVFLRAAISFQNYTLLPLFLIAITGLFLASFTSALPERRRHWLIASVLCACALQLHGSALFYWSAGLLMQAFAPWLGLRRVDKKTFAGGCLLFLAVIAPYYLSNWIWGAPTAYWQSSEHANVLTFKAFVDSLSSANETPRETLLAAVSHLHQLGKSLLSAPALMTILFVVAVWFEDRRRTANLVQRQLQRVCLVLMALSVFPGSFSLLSPGRQRYLICFAIAFAFWIAAWTDARVRFTRVRFYSLLGFIAAGSIARAQFSVTQQLRFVLPDVLPWSWFAGAVLTAALAYYLTRTRRLHAAVLTVVLFMSAFAVRTNLTDAYSPGHAPVSALEKVLDRIVRETGWTWEQAKERIYLVAFKTQGSFAPIYRDRFARAAAGTTGSLGPEGVDGYLLIQRVEITDSSNLTEALLRARVPQEIKKAMANGHFKVVSFENVPPLVVAGYRITEPLQYPRFVQNVGSSYLDMTDTSLSPTARAARSVYQIADDHTRFVFNDCTTLDPYCDVIYDVSLNREARRMQVRISGNALAQVEHKVSPAWGQMLAQPYLKVKCGDKKMDEKIVLTKYIGHVARGKNTMLLTPFSRELPWPCGESAPVEKLSAGWDGGMVARFRKPETTGGAEIEHRLPLPERRAAGDY